MAALVRHAHGDAGRDQHDRADRDGRVAARSAAAGPTEAAAEEQTNPNDDRVPGLSDAC
ncbi:hypothetical protein [Micromonospora carbonacea]|uniref:hypothetical protein n=1 Tax=Micromonospora carbonacea TaxID=47853 RepID=UPI003D70EDE7